MLYTPYVWLLIASFYKLYIACYLLCLVIVSVNGNSASSVSLWLVIIPRGAVWLGLDMAPMMMMMMMMIIDIKAEFFSWSLSVTGIA